MVNNLTYSDNYSKYKLYLICQSVISLSVMNTAEYK